MKKIICLVLGLVLTCSLASIAFAAEETVTTGVITASSDDGSTWEGADEEGIIVDMQIPVKASAALEVEEDLIEATYYVVINWEIKSTLAYVTDEDSYTWNVEDVDGVVNGAQFELKENAEAEKWEGDATITFNMVNWSNRDVKATVQFVPNTTEDGTTVTEAISVAESENSVLTATTTMGSAAAGLDIDTGNSSIDSTGGVAGSPAVIKINSADISGAIMGTDATIGHVTIVIVEDTAGSSN